MQSKWSKSTVTQIMILENGSTIPIFVLEGTFQNMVHLISKMVNLVIQSDLQIFSFLFP